MALMLPLLVAWWTLGLLYWLYRSNRSTVDPTMKIETWAAVNDGLHNSNTDLIFWREAFYLVHAASPYHLGSKQCRLVLRRSADARQWQTLTEFQMPDQDIRDPKFAVIGGQLFLYALPNRGLKAVPYATVYSVSDDGETWTRLAPLEPKGWLFWRPKTRDGIRWYVPAYWHEHGASALLTSTDGVAWTEVSRIYTGEANDETDIAFLPDGRLLATARLEGRADSPFGDRDAATLLAVAAPPYREWQCTKTRVTRLDGPALFNYGGRIFAVARYQPGRRGLLTRLGSSMSRKRTSLFLVEPERLTHLSDLPSAGDTSYAGVVVRGDELMVSYYSSDIDRDYPWVVGMFARSEIRMARVDLQTLQVLAERAIGDGNGRSLSAERRYGA
ncbi:MAG: exo-alpha-sialidase [Deltaproteobacteria bacterium]|nr:exo-alpha-sialidase [Deltaproteobacteria bacterium]